MEENKSGTEENNMNFDGESGGGGAIFCPQCGKRIPADSVYCEFCGGYVPDEEENSFSGKLRETLDGWSGAGMKKWLIGGAAVLIFLIILIAVTGGRTARPDENLFYIKDNSLYGFDPLNRDGGSREYSAAYLEKWGGRSGGGVLPGRADREEGKLSGGLSPAYSESGPYLFFAERGEKGSFDLNRTDLKKNETKTLDSGVTEFYPIGQEEVIYRKENQALFYYDKTRKTRLAAKTEYFQVSVTGDALIWTTDEDGVMDLYYQNPAGGEKVRLERGATLLDASADLNTILVRKENTVILIRDEEQKEKLAEEVVQTAGADAGQETFYFVRDAGQTPSSSFKELCYYEAGESRVLDDSLKEILWQQDGVVLYTGTDDEKSCRIAVDGRIGDLGREVALPDRVKLDGEQIYFLTPGESGGNNKKAEYELCRAKLGTDAPGHAETVDKGVSQIACAAGGKVYYFKDSDDGIGDLYCDGELAAYDAAVGSAAADPDGRQVYCIADCSRAKKRGTLMVLDAAGNKNIADGVFAYSVSENGGVLLLTEYNREKERGDLLWYDGAKVFSVDTDVWGYYETGAGGICR